MATEEEIIETDHFIMLDVLNTIIEDEISKGCSIVQIVDSLNKNSFQNVEAIKSHIESTIKFEEKREDLFTISLNTAEDYKNQLFR